MRFTFILIFMTAACVGAPLTTTFSAGSPSPTADVFGCARQQLKVIDFVQSSVDVNDRRLNAREYDETARRPDVTFRRVVDRLEIEATPASANAVTTLTVNARTFGEYANQRGPTEVQERTSETAKKAAQAIIDACGGEVASPTEEG
ncbi:MAG TPA: hypothetical protein VFU40_08185 [Gemmatimonadales bacterium]|nr:hypothetical protein [Gemmatimonadales bacterium]